MSSRTRSSSASSNASLISEKVKDGWFDSAGFYKFSALWNLLGILYDVIVAFLAIFTIFPLNLSEADDKYFNLFSTTVGAFDVFSFITEISLILLAMVNIFFYKKYAVSTDDAAKAAISTIPGWCLMFIASGRIAWVESQPVATFTLNLAALILVTMAYWVMWSRDQNKYEHHTYSMKPEWFLFWMPSVLVLVGFIFLTLSSGEAIFYWKNQPEMYWTQDFASTVTLAVATLVVVVAYGIVARDAATNFFFSVYVLVLSIVHVDPENIQVFYRTGFGCFAFALLASFGILLWRTGDIKPLISHGYTVVKSNSKKEVKIANN